MPHLFAGVKVPIAKTNSSWMKSDVDELRKGKTLEKNGFSLTRRQCACLLAHSLFGSLKRPNDVEPNNFRFTVVDLFMGTAVSSNSATTFLNYFTMLGKHGVPDHLGPVTFERRGFCPSNPPWAWEKNDTPLCDMEIVTGSIEDCSQVAPHAFAVR
eukprot:1669923-Rhodomonas_salina.1